MTLLLALRRHKRSMKTCRSTAEHSPANGYRINALLKDIVDS